MKRFVVFFAVLCLLTLSFIPSSSACIPAPQSCDWCMEITREQANQTCRAQAEFEYSSCRILGGNVDYCGGRADKWYIDCMSAHGWPVL